MHDISEMNYSSLNMTHGRPACSNNKKTSTFRFFVGFFRKALSSFPEILIA